MRPTLIARRVFECERCLSSSTDRAFTHAQNACASRRLSAVFTIRRRSKFKVASHLRCWPCPWPNAPQSFGTHGPSWISMSPRNRLTFARHDRSLAWVHHHHEWWMSVLTCLHCSFSFFMLCSSSTVIFIVKCKWQFNELPYKEAHIM